MSWILYINTSITVKLEQLRDICVKEELSRENYVFLSRFPNALFAWLPFKSHSNSFNYSVSNSQIASRKRITRCWCKQSHRQHVKALRTMLNNIEKTIWKQHNKLAKLILVGIIPHKNQHWDCQRSHEIFVLPNHNLRQLLTELL